MINLILCSVIVIFVMVLWRWRNSRYEKEAALLHEQNKMIEISLKMKTCCLKADYKSGQFEHDSFCDYLNFASRNPSKISWIHGIRFAFSSSYRKKVRGKVKSFYNNLEKMNPELLKMYQDFSDSEFRIFLMSHPLFVSAVIAFVIFKTLSLSIKSRDVTIALRDTRPIPA